ncbi:hypothetical protein NDU88_000573 [Pleurodeles waltl]|uniref:WAP domain-containing protein n=1 Tax=Pleurodeles waltl TaxID=8319 RepID=A0AAV7P8M9_PLEWA|nr:hypothetical protein NDU88_000573 [Pleurodeles waltl]
MKILILSVLVAAGLAAADHPLPPASSPPPPARRSEPFLPPPGGTPMMHLHENAITSPPPGVPPFMSLPGMPPLMLPHGGSPFPMPPGFPDLSLVRNCTQNTDCSGELRCCWLPCGRKCIPLVPDVTRPEGPKVCPEDILRKLNISNPPSGFPDPSTIRNCSHSTECGQNLKCCLTPYGGKCMPTISYNSSTEGFVNMCPMDFFIMLFTPKNQSGGLMMPGPGDHPHIFGDFYPSSMDSIPIQLNTLITGIAAEVKRQVPWKSKEVDNINNRIKEKVREAFHSLQEKVKAGMDALKTVHKLLKDNNIPKPKIIEILTNTGKACPADKKEGPWNVAQKIDTVMAALKKFQLTTPPKSSRP